MPAPLFAVLVRGPSMAPTLRDGDAVLVRRGGRAIRPGDVVVARFRARPDLLVVKRAVRADAATAGGYRGQRARRRRLAGVRGRRRDRAGGRCGTGRDRAAHGVTGAATLC